MNYLNLVVCSVLALVFLVSGFMGKPIPSVTPIPGIVFGICFGVLAGLSFMLIKQK